MKVTWIAIGISALAMLVTTTLTFAQAPQFKRKVSGQTTASELARPKSRSLSKKQAVVSPPQADYDKLAAIIQPRLTPLGTAWTQQKALELRRGVTTTDDVRNQTKAQIGSLLTSFSVEEEGNVDAVLFVILNSAVTLDSDRITRPAIAASGLEIQRGNSGQQSQELEMIDIQQLMSKRAQILQITTDMMNNINESSKGISNNIR
jgi:hypothetical protein